MRRWVRVAALAVVTASFGLAGVARAETAAMKALAAAADKEGEILLSWSSDSMGGAAGAEAFQNAINHAYGTHLTIKWTPGPSMPNVGNQIAMSHANGLPSPVDVYLGFSRNYGQLLKYHLFETAPWKSYIPDRLTDAVVEKGAYVKVVSATTGFTYNTKLAPFPPKTLADFLKPQWKGKIGTTAFGAGWDQIASTDAWGPERAIAYAEKFSKQIAGFMRCSDIDRLESGEFVALVTDCSDASSRRAIARGAPLARVVAPTVPLVSYFYFAVPKNAPHPNAGKLFVAFSATKEGQAIILRQNGSDLDLFPGSEEGKIIHKVERTYHIKFKVADIDWQIANTAGNAAQHKIAQIIRQGRSR